jgi:biopolymer transport protein ExbD
MSKRRRDRDEAGVEANLIPVLSCMFLLIPALLLAMEVAPFTQVTVRPPQWSAAPGKETTVASDVQVRVMILAEGLRAEVRRTNAPGPDIKTIPKVEGDHDFARLQAHATDIKREFPGNSTVELTAEGDVPLTTLVQTMDALRGTRCSLTEASAQSAEPDACLLWNVLITS